LPDLRGLSTTDEIAGRAGFGKRHIGVTLAGIADNGLRNATYQYLEHIDAMREQGIGIVLGGGRGTGKTSVLALVAEWYGLRFGVCRESGEGSWRRQYRRALYASMPAVCRMFGIVPSDGEKESWQRHYDELVEVELLLLDEFNSFALGEWGQTHLLNIMDERVSHQRITCLAINGTWRDLEATDNAALKRIVDKLRETLMTPIEFPGASRREFLAWESLCEKR
jgi:DNA replication protein DnaC